MRIITKMRKQTAVYWETKDDSAAYDKYGQPVLKDPVQIKCRWVDTIEEFLDSNGVTQLSQSKVYVDRDVTLGGYLFLGTLGDLDSDTDPSTFSDAWEIKRFENLPTLKANAFLKTVYL